MNSIVRILLSLILAFPLACAVARKQPEPTVRVQVTRDSVNWTADYQFGRKMAAWAFVHSAPDGNGGSWRAGHWTVATPGVRLERRGSFDLLVSETGAVPLSVKIQFQPRPVSVAGGYTPGISFSNGSTAIFSDQFDLVPVEDAAAEAGLPTEPDRLRKIAVTRAVFRDRGGRVLYQGKRVAAAVVEHGRTYVIFGPLRLVEQRSLVVSIDAGLPEWIQEELRITPERLLNEYGHSLGPRRGARPTLMASWRGPTPRLGALNGGVLNGMIMMEFEGVGFASRSKPGSDRLRWFIAHEMSHLWLGETVTHDSQDAAWMIEGGADLLAVRALAKLFPDYDPHARLDAAIHDCGERIKGVALNGARGRGDYQAYYDCGAVLGLVAGATAGNAGLDGFAGFWKRLIETNRKTGIISEDDWLAVLAALRGDAEMIAAVRAITGNGVSDPHSEIRRLLALAKIAFRVDENGHTRLR